MKYFKFSIVVICTFPFSILCEFSDAFANWLEKLIIKYKLLSFILQKFAIWGPGALLFGEADVNVLQDIAQADDMFVFPSIQKELFQLNHSVINRALLKNPNLIPELFPQLCLQNSAKIISLHKSNFQYQNPQTQELLEKYILLS